jgi:hypothetical protein
MLHEGCILYVMMRDAASVIWQMHWALSCHDGREMLGPYGTCTWARALYLEIDAASTCIFVFHVGEGKEKGRRDWKREGKRDSSMYSDVKYYSLSYSILSIPTLPLPMRGNSQMGGIIRSITAARGSIAASN